MKRFGPHRVAHVSVVTVRFQEDAQNLRDGAAGQLQLHQLVAKNLHRLRRRLEEYLDWGADLKTFTTASQGAAATDLVIGW